MKSRTILYSILLISIAAFVFYIGFITVFPSYGTIEFPGEGVYTGELKGRTTFHGQGIWTSEFNTTYIGEFKDGYFHGLGTMTFPNGSQYIGEFNKGYMHGKGKMTFPDGHTHEGYWDADEFLGDHEDCDHGH